MYAISESALWIKEPSADVGVVIVTSAALPKYFIDRLHVAIADWDQVAYLVVKQPGEFMLDWLRAGADLVDAHAALACDASHLLRSVTKGTYLLDIETHPAPGLTWLGSVCGHKLRVINLGKAGPSNAIMDAQLEDILSVVRSLAKKILQERCIV